MHETRLTHEPEGRRAVRGHEPEAERAAGDHDDGVAARAQQPHALRQHFLPRARPLRRRLSELYHSNSLKLKDFIVKNYVLTHVKYLNTTFGHQLSANVSNNKRNIWLIQT